MPIQTEEQIEAAKKTERRQQWERRFQSVMVSLAVAGVYWIGDRVVQSSEAIAVLTVQNANIQVEQSRAAIEIGAGRGLIMGRLDSVEDRVLTLEMYHRTEPAPAKKPRK